MTRSHLAVNLTYFKNNLEEIKKYFPKNEILLMVKADAYGHGLLNIVDYAHLACGINYFGVASLFEGLKIRMGLPDSKSEVFVFSDLQLEGELAKEYLGKRLIPVISHLKQLEFFIKNFHPSKYRIPLCLKFNTGMNRLGIWYEDVDSVVEILKKNGIKEIDHLLTHFANGSQSMSTNNRNQWQQDRFVELKEKFLKANFKIKNTSISNSGALEQGVGIDETHIRPGLIAYGPTSLNPGLGTTLFKEQKIISSLKTSVINTFPVKKGDPIGYGSIAVPFSGVIAIIGVGYGDGIITHYRGATFKHKGVEGKVVGRVCMDMTYVLFPEGTDIQRGEEFVVWDHDPQFFATLAHDVGVIPYELVIQLSSRIPRTYHE